MNEPDLILKAKIDGKEVELAIKPSDYDKFYNALSDYRRKREREERKYIHGDKIVRDAAEIAVEVGKISTSLLQRRLLIGYGRAASIIDELEEMGVIGPNPGGNKARAILISSMDEYPDS